MVAGRFDTLARLVGRRTSRRSALASALAAITGSIALADDAAARPPRRICRTSGTGCTSHSQCCTGHCDARRSLPRRQRFRCACPPATISCHGACIDPATDSAHCGTCANACPDDRVCVDRACQCAATLTACDDACVDTTSDADHCGDCNTPCGPGETCEAGTCRCGSGGGCGDFSTCIDGVCRNCGIAPGAVGCFRTIEDGFESWQLAQYQGLPGQGPLACASSAWCVDNYLDTCRDGTYDCFCITGYSTAAEPDQGFGSAVCGWAFR